MTITGNRDRSGHVFVGPQPSNHLAAPCLALLGALLGCETDLREKYPPPPPPSPATAEQLQISGDLPGRLVSAICEYYRRCPVEAQLVPWLAREIEEAGACEDPARWTWIEVSLRPLLPGIERGILRWNQGALDAVFANLSNCAWQANEIELQQLIEGNRPPGAPCSGDFVCEPQLRCLSTNVGCDGFCVPVDGHPGSSCSDDDDCYNSSCVDQVCVLPRVPRPQLRPTIAQAGEPCDSPAALPSRICALDAFCQGFNENAICVARSPVGAPCMEHLPCTADAFCDSGVCAPLARVQTAGVNCGDVGYCVWSAGLTCERSWCTPRDVPLGGQCGRDFEGRPFGVCATPNVCVDGLCSRGLALGDECRTDTCQAPYSCQQASASDISRACTDASFCE